MGKRTDKGERVGGATDGQRRRGLAKLLAALGTASERDPENADRYADGVEKFLSGSPQQVPPVSADE